jgi:nitrite reductase (NADH) large subunit
LLGLEAANGLTARGMQVTVIHLADWLLERQLDRTAAKLLQANLAERGIEFALNAHTAACLGDDSGRVRAVQLKDGREIPADLVVMAAGVRPDVRLATQIGLQCNRGVLVSDTLQTLTDPRIYAVGECANHRGTAYGLVAPLYEQAVVCANHLADFGIGRYLGSQVSTKLKVTGIDLFSAGDFMGGEGTEAIVLKDPLRGVYKKLVLKGDALVGACLYGDIHDGSWYFDLIKQGQNIAEQRNTLAFGPQLQAQA